MRLKAIDKEKEIRKEEVGTGENESVWSLKDRWNFHKNYHLFQFIKISLLKFLYPCLMSQEKKCEKILSLFFIVFQKKNMTNSVC